MSTEEISPRSILMSTEPISLQFGAAQGKFHTEPKMKALFSDIIVLFFLNSVDLLCNNINTQCTLYLIRHQNERPASPKPSALSMRSHHSMGAPIVFQQADGERYGTLF